MRALILAMICAMPAVASAQSHYLNIYNTAPSSLVAIGPRRLAAERFASSRLAASRCKAAAIRRPSPSTVTPGVCATCASFADGRVLTHRDFNVCRDGTYETGRYWRAAMADPKFTARR